MLPVRADPAIAMGTGRVWFVAFNNDSSSKMYMTHLRHLLIPLKKDAKKHNKTTKQKIRKNTTTNPKMISHSRSKESLGNFFIAALISMCVCVGEGVENWYQVPLAFYGNWIVLAGNGNQLRLSARISCAAFGGSRRQNCR